MLVVKNSVANPAVPEALTRFLGPSRTLPFTNGRFTSVNASRNKVTMVDEYPS